MTSVLLDLQYLPSISWFLNFLIHDQVQIEREENFVKSTARNRCEIAGSGGKLVLSIPLKGGRDHHRKYRETEISYQLAWQAQHWQSIISAYGSAPFFEFYYERFQKFYDSEYPLLFDFNHELLEVVLAVLKLNNPLVFTTQYDKVLMDKTDGRSSRSAGAAILLPRYYQVFEDKHGFISDLSILDLIFHEGPRAADYLRDVSLLK